jgi:hypothetical protein
MLTAVVLCAAMAIGSVGTPPQVAPIPEAVPEDTFDEVEKVTIYSGGGSAAGAASSDTAEEPEAELTPDDVEADATDDTETNGLVPTWNVQLGGEASSASGSDMAIDEEGATYMVGWTDAAITDEEHLGKNDAFITRIAPDGELDWVIQFGTPETDRAAAILFDGESLLVAGTTQGSLFDDVVPNGINPNPLWSWDPVDLWLTRYATDGTLEWSTQLGLEGQFGLSGLSMVTDTEGNIYMTFTTMGHLPGSEDLDEEDRNRVNIGLVKCDPDGELLWTKCIGRDGRDSASELLITDEGTLYIIGNTSSEWDTPLAENDSNDLLIVAVDSEGEELWAKQYGSARYDTPSDALLDDTTGDIYITGYTGADLAGEHQGESDGFLLALDNEGQWLWIDAIATLGSDMPGAVTQDADGMLVVLGTQVNAGHDARWLFAMQYDTDGNRTSEVTIDTGDYYPSINRVLLAASTGHLHTAGGAAKTSSANWSAAAMTIEYPFPTEDAPEEDAPPDPDTDTED